MNLINNSLLAYYIRRARSWTPAALFADGQQGVWLEPSFQTSYQDAAQTTLVTADGDPLGAEDDRSPNGNDVTQGTAARKPTFKTDGRLFWVSADGVDDFLSTGAITEIPQPFAIAAAWRLHTFDGLQHKTVVAERADFRPYVGQSDMVGDDAEGTLRYYAGGAIIDSVQTVPVGTDVVDFVQFDGVASFGRRNGVQVSSGDPGSAALSGITIGGWRAAQDPNARIYGVVVVSGRPTPSDIEKHLASLAGITL